MQAILNIGPDEIDDKLLTVIKELLSKNVEVTLKNYPVELMEFDASLPLDDLMKEFEDAGYSDQFLGDLKRGFETSEVYVG